ncbi:MAG: hypothetical protein ACYSX0_19930 [Planctomycetota bacterium]|jgi:hypothetical protein
MPQRATWLFVAMLIAGCAETGKKTEPERVPPDEKALKIETIVKARTGRLVLSERWRKEMKVEAIRVEEPSRDTLRARGSVVLDLRNLHVELADTLEVTFLPDHENLLFYAEEVALFRQQRGLGHKTENVSAITMANDQVSYFSQ